MKTGIVVLGLGGLVVASGAAALGLGGKSSEPPGWTLEARLQSIEQDLESLRALADAVAQLETRVEIAEGAALPAPRVPAPPSRPEPTAAEAAGAGAVDPTSTPLVVDDRLRVAIARVLEEEREAAEQLEAQRREQRRLEQMERRLDRLATDLGLDAQQKEALGRILLEDEERRRDLRDRFERGEADWGDPGFREELNEYVAARDERLAAFLTPDQLERYRQTPEGRVVGFLRRGFGTFGGGEPGEGGRGRRRDFGPR